MRAARRAVRRRQAAPHRSRRYSTGEKERLTRRYTSEISPLIGPAHDIPAPDIGTDEQTMAWLMHTYSVQQGHTVLGVTTGKPVSLGGSLGRATATSRGVVHVALEGKPVARDPVDGATAAGRASARSAGVRTVPAEAGVRVVAVSDQYGAVASHMAWTSRTRETRRCDRFGGRVRRQRRDHQRRAARGRRRSAGAGRCRGRHPPATRTGSVPR